ncbi:MAG: Wzz/FepE/Etk N-terminal domain-containing protein [Deltaproteobacteria bacterium]
MPNQIEQRNFDYDEDEIRLIDLIYPIYKHRRFLILFCLVVVLAVAAISLTMSKTYEATGVILPEPKEAGAGEEVKAAFLQQFGVAGIMSSAATPAEVFEAILKSRELARQVLYRYNYFRNKGVIRDKEDEAVKSFVESIKVKKSRDEPTLSVSVQGHSPVFAADIANTYIIELDKYNRENTLTSTKRLRKYIESRLDAAEIELDEAQQNLRKFQEEHRAISISKQAEATLNVLSEMESQRVALEVEKAAKEKFYSGPHIEIEQLKAKMEALQKNINRLTYSEEEKVPVEREEGKVEFYIPLTRIPALNFDESKLLLKVKAKTGVVSMLTTQLEQARLEEAKDMPTIHALDWARPPQRPAKPRLKLNVILGFVVSLFIGIFLVFFMEFMERMDQDPETSSKWREIKTGLRNMIPFKRKSRKNR